MSERASIVSAWCAGGSTLRDDADLFGSRLGGSVLGEYSSDVLLYPPAETYYDTLP